MNIKGKIIAIGGSARSGKDTLGKNLVNLLDKRGIKANTYSFADQLKKEVDSFLIKTLNISAFTENDDEKLIIRPFLVFWGTEIRRKYQDNIWIDKLSQSLKDNEVTILTDLRFENELFWVKENDGLTIFVSRIDENGNLIKPANSYEELNNVLISNGADNNLTWITSNDENILEGLAHESLSAILTEERFEQWKAISL